MKSMTGFGTCQKKIQHVNVEVSIRAVNGRYFDVKLHLPQEYQSLEKDIREILSKSIARGSISVIVSRKRQIEKIDREVRLDFDLARRYVAEMKRLTKELKIKGEPSLDVLMSMPDILTADEDSAASKQEATTVLKAVREAIEQFNKERVREGASLKQTISKRIEQLETVCGQIESSRAEANAEMRVRLEKRVEELKLKTFDSQRVSDEIVWLLDKSDIDEELTRLREHLHHVRQLLKGEESQGKKLDFYTQELLREVNTIGSKANHGQITQAVIESKNLIEQIKEQVQNIE